MELENLQQTWQALDKKLSAQIQLNTRWLRQANLDKARGALGRLSWWLGVEVIVTVAMAMWLGWFVVEHRAHLEFVLSALLLGAGTLALIASAIRQLVSIRELDFSQPIVAIQKEMELLRAARIRTTRWALIAGPLVWVPALVVLVKGLFNVDLYQALDLTWIISNLAFGVVVIVVALWVSRRYGDRLRNATWIRRLVRDLGGQNLAAAEGFVADIGRFEQEF